MRKSSDRKTKEKLAKDFEEKLNMGYNLVDYFLTIGVEPEIFLSPWLYESPIEELNTTYREQLRPKLLNKFPSLEKKYLRIDDSIIHHCFPLGFKVQEFTYEKPESKVFSIILDNNNYSIMHQSKYAVCLLFYESINEYMKLYEKYFNINTNNSNINNTIKKSYNVNTFNNSLSLENGLLNFNDSVSNFSTNTYNNDAITKKINNFSIISNNRLSEYSQKETNMTSFFNNKYFKKYYIPKCICLISLYPFITELTTIIKLIYKYSLLEKLVIPLEKFINNLVLEVPIPPRGLYSIEYPIFNQTILLKNSKLNELFYANFEFNLLFTKFNIEQVLTIFQYLMLGTKLIFFSSRIEFLTPIILASLVLLFPFKFPFTIVSILPKESYYLIDNITPEIFGVNEKYHYSFFQENDIEINDHLLIIDIDEKKIIPCGPKTKEELPALPKVLKGKLSEKLKSYISLIHKNMKKEIKEPLKIFQSKIRNIFLEFQIELLKDYPKFLNSNIYKHPSERPFNIKKFLNSVPSDDHSFYEKFIETQLFNDYILKRMTPKDKNEQTEILYFEEKIFFLKQKSDKIIFLNSPLFNFKNEYKVPKVTSSLDEELFNLYINEQINKKLLLDGISVDILKNNELNLKDRSKSENFVKEVNLRKNFNETKPLFNYILFPKLCNDLFFKAEVKNYYLDLSIFNEIKNINSELISKSHLSRVELITNEMSNFVYILWLKVWANSFYYQDKIEQKYRYLQMLKVFNKVNQHEMNVINNLFQSLIKANVDEDLIFYLYNKILQLKLSPSFEVYNAIKNKIRKKTKNSTMPSSEINKYLLNRGQIHFNKNDINKKCFRKRTMKNIYDMYMIKEKVTFIMEEICSNCDRKIDIYHFQKNIDNTNNDIVWAKCPFCKFGYLPKLKVVFGDEFNKNNKLINSTSIVDEVILYSPKTLKMNFFDNSNIEVDNLKLNYNPAFWNLIWYFKINGLPFDFLLPYEENIFFKKKMKRHNFFKVNISNKSEYIEKSGLLTERNEKRIKNLSELNNLNPNVKLNNNINNNNQESKINNLNIILNQKDYKAIKPNIYNINLNNSDKNIINNLKIPNKLPNNTTNNFYNNSIGNISILSSSNYYNSSLIHKNNKKSNNLQPMFINNGKDINIPCSKNKSSLYDIKRIPNDINNSPNNNKKLIINSVANNARIINNKNSNLNVNKTVVNNVKNQNNMISKSMAINNSKTPNNMYNIIINNPNYNNSINNHSIIISKNIINNTINNNNKNLIYNINNNKLYNNYLNFTHNSNISNITSLNKNKINIKKVHIINTQNFSNNNYFYNTSPYFINNIINNITRINNSYDPGIINNYNNNYKLLNNYKVNLARYVPYNPLYNYK